MPIRAVVTGANSGIGNAYSALLVQKVSCDISAPKQIVIKR